MAYQQNWILFGTAFIAMAVVFGQIPITDAVLSRYVPDRWRAKVLSIKFMLNLCLGAAVLPFASYVLQNGGGFETILVILAGAALLIVCAALILPYQAPGDERDNVSSDLHPAE